MSIVDFPDFPRRPDGRPALRLVHGGAQPLDADGETLRRLCIRQSMLAHAAVDPGTELHFALAAFRQAMEGATSWEAVADAVAHLEPLYAALGIDATRQGGLSGRARALGHLLMAQAALVALRVPPREEQSAFLADSVAALGDLDGALDLQALAREADDDVWHQVLHDVLEMDRER